jgi:hypothetical protein
MNLTGTSYSILSFMINKVPNFTTIEYGTNFIYSLNSEENDILDSVGK